MKKFILLIVLFFTMNSWAVLNKNTFYLQYEVFQKSLKKEIGRGKIRNGKMTKVKRAFWKNFQVLRRSISSYFKMRSKEKLYVGEKNFIDEYKLFRTIYYTDRMYQKEELGYDCVRISSRCWKAILRLNNAFIEFFRQESAMYKRKNKGS